MDEPSVLLNWQITNIVDKKSIMFKCVGNDYTPQKLHGTPQLFLFLDLFLFQRVYFNYSRCYR